MARVFSESFEGTGYENAGWAETVGTLCTCDENSAGPGSLPSGLGTQCLRIARENASYNVHTVYDHGGNITTTRWVRLYVYVDSTTLATTEQTYLWFGCSAADPVSVGAAVYFQLNNTAGSYYFRFGYHTSVGHNLILSSAINLDTWYRLEAECGGSTVEFKLDGVTQDERVTGVTLDRNWRYSGFGMFYSAGVNDYYIDGFALDDATWVGAEVVTDVILRSFGITKTRLFNSSIFN